MKSQVKDIIIKALQDAGYDIVKLIKQQTTHYLWQKYPNFLSKCYWKHKIFWSDGYFACSIGEVSSATIQKYIENQG
jgi:putative transposase|nr:transposase [Butyrivibrio sp.]